MLKALVLFLSWKGGEREKREQNIEAKVRKKEGKHSGRWIETEVN
jgi:hypothetical protein